MLLNYIYNIILIFVCFKAFILGRKYGFSSQNNIFFYLLITVFVESFSFIVDYLDKNTIVGIQYNLYLIFVLFFFYFYYSHIISASFKIISKVILIIFLIFILLFTKIAGLHFDEKIAVIVMLFLISHSIIWFCNKILTVNEDKIFSDPNFWISSGFLIWACFGIFRCLPMYYFYETDKEFLSFIKTNFNIVNIILYILIFISLLKYERLSKSRATSNN